MANPPSLDLLTKHLRPTLTLDEDGAALVMDATSGRQIREATAEEAATLAELAERAPVDAAPEVGEKAANLPRLDRFVTELGTGDFVDVRSGQPVEPSKLGARPNAARVIDPSQIARQLDE